MNSISDYTEIADELRRIKKINNTLLTNFYANKSKIAYWLKNGLLFLKVLSNTTFIFRKNSDFFHLYFISSNGESLKFSMDELLEVVEENFVVDLVGTGNEIDYLSAILQAKGYKYYESFVRMSINEKLKTSEYRFNSEIKFAEYQDLYIINSFLTVNLDKYTAQLPDIAELREMIGNKCVLVYKEDNLIGGLFYYEKIGVTAHIRGCIVAEQYRNRNIGYKMLHSFFSISQECKRFILWVNLNNSIVMKVCKYYGFKTENFKDSILIKLKE